MPKKETRDTKRVQMQSMTRREKRLTWLANQVERDSDVQRWLNVLSFELIRCFWSNIPSCDSNRWRVILDSSLKEDNQRETSIHAVNWFFPEKGSLVFPSKTRGEKGWCLTHRKSIEILWRKRSLLLEKRVYHLTQIVWHMDSYAVDSMQGL